MAARLPASRLLTASFAASAALSILAQTPPANSPFVPPPSAAPASADNGSLQLVGMTVVGRDTLLSIRTESDQRSVWIPVGKTVAEITAVSYDAKAERAVVRHKGENHTLILRKAAVAPADAPAPAAAPTPSPRVATPPTTAAEPAAPLPPLTPQQEKEMEARMLVTDLLEIGQRQRQAYEEAQRKAAAEAAAKPNAPAPPSASAPTPTSAPKR